MFKLVPAFVALPAMLCVFAACRSESKAPAAEKSDRAPAPLSPAVSIPVAEAALGTIRGFVRFKGRAPVQPVIDFSSNPQCEREHPKPVRTETVAVNPNRTLRDTFVWIKSGLSQARWTPPVAAAELDQAGCMYRPHVLGLMVNQDLEIRNSDPVNHDVHVEAVRNAASNESEPPRAETLRKRYAAEEIWFPVSCGVHPWMRSYLAVVSHPFFAVTGTSGSFELRSVPPGQYVVESIQEKYGRKEQRVTVTPNQTRVVDFVYAE